MRTIKRMVHEGWAVRIWPHYDTYTVTFSRAGAHELIGRGESISIAAKKALKGLK